MQMNRRDFLGTAGMLAAGATFLPSSLRAALRDRQDASPNIIMIIADDLTPNYLGCYGGPTPTPNLDQLAAGGVKFQQAHCVTPLCNPSRYTLLAGEYPGRNLNVIEKTPEGQPYHMMQSTKWVQQDPSIARQMNEAGYTTGFVGKWHSNFELEAGYGFPEGFDPDTPQGDAFLRKRQATQVEGIREISGFDFVSNVVVGNLGGIAKKFPKFGYHNPEWQTQGALDFIDQSARGDKPFFLHLANSIPHSPDNLDSLEQSSQYTLGGKLDAPLDCHPPRETVKQRLKKAGLPITGPLASINAGTIVLDDQLGAIRKKLDELGIADNTMIVWFADHSIYGKGTVYAPGTHVPMIAHWPKSLPKGTEVQTPVSLIDLFPTSVALAGGTAEKSDGTNILPLMQAKTTQHKPIYQECLWHRGIRKGNLHYVAYRIPEEFIEKMESGEVDFAIDNPGGRRGYANGFGNLNLPFKPHFFDPEQLYDLEKDPFERNNVAEDPAYADQLKELKDELFQITATFKRPFPKEAPAFMTTEKYAQLVEKRKKMADEQEHYPEGHDGEKIYNLNLKDPLADY